ncbi:MAG: SOS response-associated peptidase [Myxococcota bacterium]
MCGRYTLACANEDALLDGLPYDAFSETRIQFRPRYNIGPGQRSPVLFLAEGDPVLADMEWGVPREGGGTLINARSEGASRSSRFSDAFRRGRCLVPADGFYEWRTEGTIKQPYLFRPTEGGLLLMAGLLEEGRFVVLTTKADDTVSEIHDRMPVQLTREGARDWLAEGKLGKGGALRRSQVSTRVNRGDHDDPDCVAPPAQASFRFD